jgi:hypothetical protein
MEMMAEEAALYGRILEQEDSKSDE